MTAGQTRRQAGVVVTDGDILYNYNGENLEFTSHTFVPFPFSNGIFVH